MDVTLLGCGKRVFPNKPLTGTLRIKMAEWKSNPYRRRVHPTHIVILRQRSHSLVKKEWLPTNHPCTIRTASRSKKCRADTGRFGIGPYDEKWTAYLHFLNCFHAW